MRRLGIVLLVCSSSAVVVAHAQDPAKLEVGHFSVAAEGAVLPDGWAPLTFKKIERHTTYEVVREGPVSVVKAVSEASASGLTKAVVIDPQEYPIMRWRWKVENLLQKGNVTRKDGDDYPARL